MKNQITSGYSAELVAFAGERAATDKTFAASLNMASHAGQIVGASVNSAQAQSYWAELADSMADSAAYCAELGAPVTGQLVAQAMAEDANNVKALATAEHGIGTAASADDMAALQAMRDATAASAEKVFNLAAFRDHCALVSVGIKAAQATARRTAISDRKVAELAKRAKQARDRITKALERALLVYGLKVNFQAVSSALVEAKEPVDETDAQKAERAIIRAFKLDPTAAIGALLKLDPLTVLSVSRHLAAHIQAQADAEEKADAEHKAQAADDLRARMGEGSIDLVSVANAEREAEKAADKVADATAAGVAPETLKKAERNGKDAQRKTA